MITLFLVSVCIFSILFIAMINKTSEFISMHANTISRVYDSQISFCYASLLINLLYISLYRTLANISWRMCVGYFHLLIVVFFCYLFLFLFYYSHFLFPMTFKGCIFIYFRWAGLSG